MVIHLLIQQNYLTIIIVLFTIIFIVTNHSFEKSITQLFLTTVSFILVLVIVDSIELWAASWSYPSFTRKIMLACGYSLRPAVAFGIILILRRDKEKSNFLLSIPLLINTLLAFVSCFSKIMFYFTEQNVFLRGPLGYIP